MAIADKRSPGMPNRTFRMRKIEEDDALGREFPNPFCKRIFPAFDVLKAMRTEHVVHRVVFDLLNASSRARSAPHIDRGCTRQWPQSCSNI